MSGATKINAICFRATVTPYDYPSIFEVDIRTITFELCYEGSTGYLLVRCLPSSPDFRLYR